MAKLIVVVSFCAFIITSCNKNSSTEMKTRISVKYNLVEPGNGIYVVKKKDLKKEEVKNQNYEAVHYDGDKIIKIERFNVKGELTDDFSVAAVTSFEYDNNGRVKYLRYFDKYGNNWEDDLFGYWSIEYIYDENNNVRMEIYRDADSKFLEVPRDKSGNIAKINFIAPILTYEYTGDDIRIKALDKNFNLLKEVVGDKPCIPFIDCGEF